MHQPYTKQWKITRFPCKRQGRGNNLCGYYVVDYMLTFWEDTSDMDDFEVSKNWLAFCLISIPVNGLIRLILYWQLARWMPMDDYQNMCLSPKVRNFVGSSRMKLSRTMENFMMLKRSATTFLRAMSSQTSCKTVVQWMNYVIEIIKENPKLLFIQILHTFIHITYIYRSQQRNRSPHFNHSINSIA